MSPSATGVMRRVSTALAGLTGRGRAFVAAGVAGVACSTVLGQGDLMRVGMLVLAIPLVCVVHVARGRYRISCSRTLTPPRVEVGTPSRVRLSLANLSRGATGVLLAEEQVPYVMGTRPRFVVDRLRAGQQAAVGYTVRPAVRGAHRVGPLRLRVTDPFGMCEVTRAFTTTDELLVVPATRTLAPLTSGGAWNGGGGSTSPAAALVGEDDAATREYRYGDDLRRVHWRSTARRGELMVRREEQPRQARATVLVDLRATAHRGEGPSSSLEWAVEAAASVCVHLSEQGYGVRLQTDGSPATAVGGDTGEDVGVALDRLARAQAGGDDALTAAAAVHHRSDGIGLVVAVLAEPEATATAALCRMTVGGPRGVAILIDTSGWATLSAEAAADLTHARNGAAELLRRAGWLVTIATVGTPIVGAWEAIRTQVRAGAVSA